MRWAAAIFSIGALLGSAGTSLAAPALPSQCLTPGRCQGREWRKVIFPLAFRPVIGCRAGKGIVRSGPGRRQVAITFDDGPSEFTEPLLRLLRRERAPATFFVVGKMIAGREKLLRRALAQGSVIGNHSWSHPDLTAQPLGVQQSEIDDTNQAIKQASGYRPCLMRPPYGLINLQLAELSLGQANQPVLWDVDAADWESPPAPVIVSRVLAAARPGSVILLHDGGGDRAQTVKAVPRIIQGLRKRGLEPVTVPRLLGLGPKR